MKDNFDLKGYLVENKMTENSRGDVRHHLTEAVDLDMRLFKGKKLLSEVRIPADPDVSDLDMSDPAVSEGYAGPDDHGYSEFEEWYADHADEYTDEDAAYRYWEKNIYGQGIDECGDMNLGGDIPLDEASGKLSTYAFVGFIESRGSISDLEARNIDISGEINKNMSWEEIEDLKNEEGMSLLDDMTLDEFWTLYIEDKSGNVVWTLNSNTASPDDLETLRDIYNDGADAEGIPLPPNVKAALEKAVGGSSDYSLNEAGYTDDEDDYASDDLDLDDRGGASLMDLVGRDKGASRARKAAAKDTAEDPAMDDDPVDPEQGADPTDPEEDPEDAAGEVDPNAATEPGLSTQLKYNPNTVQMTMTNEELDQFLSGFRRPQVAVRVLNRALKAAQDEVNDSIGLNHLYLILENGFYVTSRSQRGDVIAKVSADQEWRKKNFGD